MKQIILITDGCSNVGISPVIAAAQAKAEHIIVNVIGVVDQGEVGEQGAREIADIAEAGGGMSRIVSSSLLAQTVQMMTRKTMVSTIQQAVNKELQLRFGGASLEALSPERRGEVVEVIDDLAESASLKVALLIDTSASMKPKLKAVEEAIRDLMLSLQARKGTSEIAVFHFPAKANPETAGLLLDWTGELAKIGNIFYKLNINGATPTGPALLKAIRFMQNGAAAERETGSGTLHSEAFTKKPHEENRDGMLSDYVV